MAIYRVDRAFLNAQEEVTFGTNPAGTFKRVGGLVASADVTPPVVEWRTYPSVGTDRHLAVVAEGRHDLGDIRIPIILQESEILQYIFEGQETLTNVPSAGYYTHLLGPIGLEHGQTGGTGAKGDLDTGLTLTRNKPELASLTLQMSYPDPDPTLVQHFVRNYSGAKVNEVVFSINSEGELQAEFDFTAAGIATAITHTSPASDRATTPYMFFQGGMQFYPTSLTESTAGDNKGRITFNSPTTYNRITDLRLTINNNLKTMYYLSAKDGAIGGKYALDLVPAQRDITLEVTAVLDDQTTGLIADGVFDNATIWKRLENEGAGQNTLAPFHVQLKFVRTTDQDEINFQLFDCWITRAPHSLPEGKAEIPVDMSITARKCRIEVINDETAATWTLA